jgi:hypothetical protein
MDKKGLGEGGYNSMFCFVYSRKKTEMLPKPFSGYLPFIFSLSYVIYSVDHL